MEARQIRQLLSIAFILFTGFVSAQTISIQGVLRDPNGRSVDDGFYNVTFSIYDVATEGTALWTSAYTDLETNHGVFQANLGSQTSLDGLGFDTEYFVGITVENFAEMSPRIPITIYPYAKAILGQENQFPSVGNVVLERDSIIVRQGALKLEGPEGRIVFNDGTSLNTAEFGGPAGSVLNPSSININADKDGGSGGTINFQIAGENKASIANNGTVFLNPIDGLEGGEVNFEIGDDNDEQIDFYGQDAYSDIFRFYNWKVDPFTFREIMRFMPDGKVGIGYGNPASRLHISDFVALDVAGGGGALTLGDMGLTNIVIDDNDIQARNDSTAATLYLNTFGGNVEVGVEDTDGWAYMAIGKEDFNDRGVLDMRGAGPGIAHGGTAQFFTSADWDTQINYYYQLAFQDDFRFGALGYGDMSMFDEGGRMGLGYFTPTSRLHVSNFEGFSLAAGDGSALTLGNDDDLNLVFDAANMQARNNGLASDLGLNPLGGAVHVGETDVVSGQLELLGALTGEGGELQIYSSGAHRGSVNYWYLDSFEDDFRIGGFGTAAPGEVIKINQNGNVGIGETNPTLAKLVVTGTGGAANSFFDYYHHLPPENNIHNFGSLRNAGLYEPTDISIRASSQIAAFALIIDSDERIKKDFEVSDSDKDLDLLQSIEITDYRMIDTISDKRTYKKVIAQQVEEVFPTAISLTQNYIPNIFSLSKKVDKKDGLYYITTQEEHGLIAGDKLKLILKERELEVTIKSTTDNNKFIVETEHDLGDEVFVYGKWVEDYRTVDYDAISMLNVSATQELAKKIEDQQARIEALEKENENLKAQAARIDALEAKLNKVLGIDEASSEKTLVGKQ